MSNFLLGSSKPLKPLFQALIRQMARTHCDDLCIIPAGASSVKMAFRDREEMTRREAWHVRESDLAKNDG